MTYVKTSVRKPQGNKSPGASAPKEPNVTIVDVDDILTWAERDGNGVLIAGSHVLKPNAQMITYYATPSSIVPTYETEGEEDAVSFLHKVETASPGDELELNELIQNWTGRNAIVILGSCSDKFRKQYGSKCAPLQLKPSLQDNNEGRKHMLNWEQTARTGYVPAHYMGELTYAEVTQADGANVTITNDSLMQRISASDAETAINISSVNADHGKIVTLIGSGGSDPAVLESGVNVILKDGANWTALEGAVLNLQVFHSGATPTLIETSRS